MFFFNSWNTATDSNSSTYRSFISDQYFVYILIGRVSTYKKNRSALIKPRMHAITAAGRIRLANLKFDQAQDHTTNYKMKHK